MAEIKLKSQYNDEKEVEVTISTEYVTEEQEVNMLAAFVTSAINGLFDKDKDKVVIDISKSYK